jgi:hypothetical protein
MRISWPELTIPLTGAAGALVAGLLLGGFMQPHLDEGDNRPAGPQMFADWAGDRSTGPFDPGTTFVSYQARMPDYVLGTDWKKAMTWPDERAAVSAPRETAQEEEPQPAVEVAALDRTIYQEPPAPLPGYPSLGGARPAGDYGVDDDTVSEPAPT